MNVLDVVIVLCAVSAAVAGYRQGFVAGSASWFGLGLGLVAGARLLPVVLSEVQDASGLTTSLVSVGLLVGTALIGNALGLVLGSRLHAELPPGAVRRADQAAGGVMGVVVVLVILWLLLPALGDTPGWMATQARGSVVAREVNDAFPDPPDTVEALRRVVGDAPFPQVIEALQPSPDTGASPGSSGLSTTTADRVVLSTVKVEGIACSRIQDGSGFFVDDGLVVTNAHVVAGEDETTVELSDGSTLDADVVAFDPGRDLAVLRTTGGGAPALPLRDALTGDVGGVFGRPGGGPLEISPFRVADEIDARGRDIYDRAGTTREVLVLAAELEPGDSGSALVDAEGRVIGVAFAVAPDRPGTAYALAIDELQAVLAGDLSTERDTGACLT
jgi:S1-C subfamily serine protease